MKPDDWNIALHTGNPWQVAYAHVKGEAWDYLKDTLNAGDLVSTNTLVEALYPARFAKGEGITARRRIYKALSALAKHGLVDCCTKGAEQKFGRSAKMVRPWLWHAPRGFEPCAGCEMRQTCIDIKHCSGPRRVEVHNTICPNCGHELAVACADV